MPEKVRVALCGIRGKMGRELAVGLAAQPDIEVVGGCDIQPPAPNDQKDPYPITQTLADLLQQAKPQVIVDFTVAEAAAANAAIALQAKVPVVNGTTGLSPKDLAHIDELAK